MNENTTGFSFARPSQAPKNPFESFAPFRQTLSSSLPHSLSVSTQLLSGTPAFGARPKGMFPFRTSSATHPLAQSTLPPQHIPSTGESTGASDGEGVSSRKEDNNGAAFGLASAGGAGRLFQPPTKDGQAPPFSLHRQSTRQPFGHRHESTQSPTRQPSYHSASPIPALPQQPFINNPLPPSRTGLQLGDQGHARGWNGNLVKHNTQPTVEDIPNQEADRNPQDTYQSSSKQIASSHLEYEAMEPGKSQQQNTPETDDTPKHPSSANPASHDGHHMDVDHGMSNDESENQHSTQQEDSSSHNLDSPSTALYLNPEAQDGTPRSQMQKPSTLAHSVRQGQHSLCFQPPPPQTKGQRQPDSSPLPAAAKVEQRTQHLESEKVEEQNAEIRGRSEALTGHREVIAAERADRDKAGSSEQVLLSMLQAKNGELDYLRDRLQKYEKVFQLKDASHKDLVSQHQHLVESYAKDEATWKMSMGSAKRWKDNVIQKEYVKAQAMKALQESYSEHSSAYQDLLGELSRDLSVFRSSTLEETQKELSAHVSTIGSIRETLNQVKQSLASRDIAVNELQSVETLRDNLEQALQNKSLELDDALEKQSGLELKLREYEETVGKDIKALLSNLDSMKASSLQNSETLQDTLRSLQEQNDRLSQKENELGMLQADYRSLQSLKESIDREVCRVESYLSSLGCDQGEMIQRIQKLSQQHTARLTAIEETHSAAEVEWASEIQVKERHAADLQATIELIKDQLATAHSRIAELQDSNASTIADSTAELKGQIASLLKTAEVRQEEERSLRRQLAELRDAEQASKDRTAALTQKSQEAELRLEAEKASLNDSQMLKRHLEVEVGTLSKQLEAHLKQQSESSHTHDLLEELQSRMEQLKSEQNDAIELQRANTQILQKNHTIASIQSSLDNAHMTIDELNGEICKLRAGFEQVSNENARAREELDKQVENGVDLIRRWERDQLSADEVVMVQRVTQQIKRGEQAFYRQELDEKANLTKKLEARCKKLESQISSLSHVKMANATPAPMTPLDITEAVAVLSPYSSSSTSTVHGYKTTFPKSPTKHSVIDSKTSFYPGSLSNKSPSAYLSDVAGNQSIGKKRRMLDIASEACEADETLVGGSLSEIDASVNEATFNLPPSTQARSSTQAVTKPQKKTRFADILQSSTPPESLLPADEDDTIDEPATSQPKQRDGPPPPSQMPKTYKRGKTGSKSKVDSLGQGAGSNVAGGDTRKLRGGRKSH
ncbi:hypothetical protein IAR50_001670 [Cryptococcus sp. DSM 104548]